MKRRAVMMAGGTAIGFFGIGSILEFSRYGETNGREQSEGPDPEEVEKEEDINGDFHIQEYGFNPWEREIFFTLANETGRETTFLVEYAFMDGCEVVYSEEVVVDELEDQDQISFRREVDTPDLEERYWWPYWIGAKDSRTGVSVDVTGGDSLSPYGRECNPGPDDDSFVIGPVETDDDG